MKITGCLFDMDFKKFTLGALFSMQLHAYSKDVESITTSAIKEQTIENEIKKLRDAWKSQNFEISTYRSVGYTLFSILKSS